MLFSKNTEIERREAEERAQIMIGAAPFCIFFWDKQFNLIECNNEALKLFDMPSKEEFFKKYSQLSPEYQPDGSLSREKGPEFVGIALKEGHVRFEWMHQKLNGEQIPAEVTCVKVKHKGDWTVIEYIRDLREQKAMIAEMHKAQIAEESSKAKSDFLAKMSHEIRTPMNAILGITEIQLQDDSIPQGFKDAFERIFNSADLLLGIINDILDLSKIEAGKLEIIYSQYDIASLIHDTVQLNMMRYESKPIEFKLQIEENVPIMLVGDELRIKQILNNILSNAFKYTQEGEICLSISMKIPEENSLDNIILVFSVSDTGQGMTADQIKKLGSEYARFNMEANRKTEGTGLGMNITRNLIKLMRGDIDIKSTPGKGSTFTVQLPQICNNFEPIGKEMVENLLQLNLASAMKIKTVKLNREFMPYGRVLIVDDVETNLYVAKGLMAPYGLSLDTAMSGYDAIDRIREGADYDIIFMDHMMPKMDGIEAAKIIRNLGYDKPIIALTANAITGQAEMFLQNGFDEFISKPIDVRQLNMSLNKYVRDVQSTEVIEAARKQKEKLTHGIYDSSSSSQLIEFFIRDAKKAAYVLEAIYINKCRRVDDIAMFIINVHSMKSALANVGENELSAEALRLEQAGREKDIKLVLNDIPSFLEKLYTVIYKFEEKEERLRELNAGEKGDVEFLKDKLLEIRTACDVFDKKAAKDLLAKVKEKSWDISVDKCLSEIAGSLLHSEFDEASDLINNFLQQSE